MNDVALERLDAHLDAANVSAAKSAYYDLWERGLMTVRELWMRWAELDAAHFAYMEWLTEDTERLMAEMGW